MPNQVNHLYHHRTFHYFHQTKLISILISTENVIIRHVDLFWNIDFKNEIISGEAVLHFDVIAKEIENIVRMINTMHIYYNKTTN